MPLSTSEGIADAFQALGIGQALISAVQALPPKPSRKATDYGKVIGLDPAGTGYRILQLIDQIEADVASTP